MRRVLRKGFQRFEILEWHETQPEHSFEEFRDRFSALAFLRGFMRDKSNIDTLRRILRGVTSSSDTSRLDDHDVVEELSWRLVSGQIKIAGAPVRMPTWSYTGVEVEEEVAAPVAAAVPGGPHWIKLQIVDEDTNEPVEGVPVKLKLPTGEVKEFKSDKNGTIEVKGVPEGTWDIEEMLDPDALEVVEVA